MKPDLYHFPVTRVAVALSFGLTSRESVFANSLNAMPHHAAAAFEAANAQFGIRPSLSPQARSADGDEFSPSSVAAMDADDLQAHIERFQQLVEIISADARQDGRELTAREERRLDAAEESLAVLRAEARGRQSRGRRSAPELRDAGSDPTTRAQAASRSDGAPQFASPRTQNVGKGGFTSAGEFLNAVVMSSAKGAKPDPRLFFDAAPATYGTEGVGADGGFAVPPEFRTAIMSKVMGEESLLSLTDQQTSSSNSIVFPADETTPWQSSGGIQAYWESEAGLKQQSKPALTEKTVKLNKIIALVPLSDELLEDAPAMAGYVNKKAPEKINFRLNDAILNGTGVGMPLGILSSPGTVVVPKEAGQVASTVNFSNLVKVWSAVTPNARRNARWFLHPDVEPQLLALAFPGVGTAVPAYLPPGGLSTAPYGTLLGRPIIYTEASPLLGSQGDVMFGDLANYLSAVKAGGVKSEMSIHLWFDYDLTAFRFVLRVGGQPWWNSPILPFQQGSATRGFFATLAARP